MTSIFTIYKYQHSARVEANIILDAEDESPCKSYRSVAAAEKAIISAKIGAGNSYRIFDVLGQKWLKKSGASPDTSLHLGDERRVWLQKHGGIQPTITRLIDDAMNLVREE